MYLILIGLMCLRFIIGPKYDISIQFILNLKDREDDIFKLCFIYSKHNLTKETISIMK